MYASLIKNWIFSLPLLAVFATPVALAAEALPIHIAADRAVVSQATGVSTYMGDVVVTRGTLVLRGDKLTIRREDGAIHALLTGNPATIERSASPEHPQPISGHAQTLSYIGADQIVELSGQAYLDRGGDAVEGKTIRHFLATGRTEATSGEGQQVRITIQPETVKQSTPKRPAKPTQPAETEPGKSTDGG
ncbi:MAG: lipopolysaccharide transport periplasmic protein LptA [Salinisphaera sp.]|nr:lipopolysaccharide transport periplasmic protein LptA [Salinisphaera sp.]